MDIVGVDTGAGELPCYCHVFLQTRKVWGQVRARRRRTTCVDTTAGVTCVKSCQLQPVEQKNEEDDDIIMNFLTSSGPLHVPSTTASDVDRTSETGSVLEELEELEELHCAAEPQVQHKRFPAEGCDALARGRNGFVASICVARFSSNGPRDFYRSKIEVTFASIHMDDAPEQLSPLVASPCIRLEQAATLDSGDEQAQKMPPLILEWRQAPSQDLSPRLSEPWRPRLADPVRLIQAQQVDIAEPVVEPLPVSSRVGGTSPEPCKSAWGSWNKTVTARSSGLPPPFVACRSPGRSPERSLGTSPGRSMARSPVRNPERAAEGAKPITRTEKRRRRRNRQQQGSIPPIVPQQGHSPAQYFQESLRTPSLPLQQSLVLTRRRGRLVGSRSL